LASKQYKKDEIIAFVVNFLLFAFWGVGLVIMDVKNMKSPFFIFPAIVMMGLSIWYMVIIFEPPKKDDENPTPKTEDAAAIQNAVALTSNVSMSTTPGNRGG
jgi:hypothetical protein